MQTGFAMLEVGSVHSLNARSTIVKVGDEEVCVRSKLLLVWVPIMLHVCSHP
jgi:hypothetical protein